MITRRAALALAAAALLRPARAPAQGGAEAGSQRKIKVVATFSILADFIRNVGGERTDVAALVGPNSDAHVYAPTPSDARTLAAARLVFVNGLGFEGWMERLVKASAAKAGIVVATKGIVPRKASDGRDHDHGHGASDPHAWQSVANAKIYVANIRDALVGADPAGEGVYRANASAYLGALDALDSEVKAAVAKIPAARRRIITTHDAFGYFADAYGISFIAPQGVSTEAEASARDVARIIAQIRQQRIPAVFLENVTDPRLLQRIGRETGAKIGGTLYSDALTGPEGPAPSYIEMMRHNVHQVEAALADS